MDVCILDNLIETLERNDIKETIILECGEKKYVLVLLDILTTKLKESLPCRN